MSGAEANYEDLCECPDCGELFIPPSADALAIIDAIDSNGRETRELLAGMMRLISSSTMDFDK